MYRWVVILALLIAVPLAAFAQPSPTHTGQALPRDVRELYERGVHYLASTQSDRGDWSAGGTESGPGVTGLCLMALLASGEDPNFGLYSHHVRQALRSIISQQHAATGYLGPSMYHHGFALLAMAEAYGSVDDRNLWSDGPIPPQRSVGAALELAVRAAVTSQKNNRYGGWRYSPDATDADTSVSGAVLMGLLAARNAGIEVPDESIDKAISYFAHMTSPQGLVAYSAGVGGFDESIARVSIGTLVFAIARRTDLPQFNATLRYLTQRIDAPGAPGFGGVEYQRYYQAQALFQGDVAAWERWNNNLVRQLTMTQQPDGSFKGQYGPVVSTSMSLLALAVNYRLLPIYER